MPVLVIAEHDHVSIKGATLNTVKTATEISMFLDGRVDLLVVGRRAIGAADAAAQIAGVAHVVHVDAPGFEHGLAEERGRAGARHRQRLQPHPVLRDRQRQEGGTARGRSARCGSSQRHHQGHQQ